MQEIQLLYTIINENQRNAQIFAELRRYSIQKVAQCCSVELKISQMISSVLKCNQMCSRMLAESDWTSMPQEGTGNLISYQMLRTFKNKRNFERTITNNNKPKPSISNSI